MTSQMIFQRYEFKYLMNFRQLQAVLTAMEPYMVPDEYSHSSIRNLYLDTPDFRLIRRSLEKPVYKEKLRVRSYGRAGADAPVFVELKKKCRSVVYKRRISMPQDQALGCLSGTELWPESQIGAELAYAVDFYKNLHPAVFLSYERDAFHGAEDKDFRVTFDTAIRYRQQELTLNSETWGTPILPPGQVLMELKVAGGLPLWMAHVLSQQRIYKTSFSNAVQLNGDGAVCNSDSVTIEGSRITIGEEGVYLLSGTLADGQIVINAGETDKVQLVLKGVDITSSTSAAIYALEADKVFITLAEGTENTLTNGGEYVAIDENNIDGVIFAKTDLTLNGSGGLTINAQAGHGVVSKDDLVITGGSYTVTAASHGLSGKDSIAIADGTFSITSGKDGIHAENSDDLTLGTLYIAGGSFTIDSQGDAVSAQGALQIDGGTFDLYTGEGSESVEMTSADELGQMGRGPRGGWAEQAEGTAAQTQEDTVSQKGIKGEGSFTVNGGTFTIDSADDCLHAGGEMLLAAGTFTLRSGDDAVHCDAALTIQSGTFTIPYCYEGIEGLSITVEDGVYDIVSHDDGLNAAGGADRSGFGGRQQDAFASGSGSFILINGGTFTIVSSGDCIDSNGDLTINGGTLELTCNGSGDTALDCDGTYTNNGGDVTTNDGSENNPGQMGGGIGGAGGQRGSMTGQLEGQAGAAPGSHSSDNPARQGGERPGQQPDGGGQVPAGAQSTEEQ